MSTVKQSFLYEILHVNLDHIWSYMIMRNPSIFTSPKSNVHHQPPSCSTLATNAHHFHYSTPIVTIPLDFLFIFNYNYFFFQLFHPNIHCSSSLLFHFSYNCSYPSNYSTPIVNSPPTHFNFNCVFVVVARMLQLPFWIAFKPRVTAKPILHLCY